MTNSDIPTIHAPRSILVGVALREPGAAAAIATAGAYAAGLGAELILTMAAPLAEPVVSDGLTALAPPLAAPFDEQEAIDRLAREHLAGAAASVPDDVPCRTVLSWGSLGPALVETAQAEGADLIALPMRRTGPIGHLLHDGTDRHVLHHSPVPVLIVPLADHIPEAA